MNWKKWKIGLLVAILTGVFSGLIGLSVGISWKAFWILLAVNIGKDALLYIKSNPIDQVSFETTRITKDEAAGTTTSQSSKTVITASGEPPPANDKTKT